MSNQQLRDYIDQQTKLKVPREAIKDALLQAGWNENDINQAIAESESGSQGQQSPSGTPSSGAAVSSGASPVNSPASSPVSPSAVVPAAGGTSKSPVSFVTSDIFRPRGESIFQPSSFQSSSDSSKKIVPDNKPEIVSAAVKDKLAYKSGGTLLTILLSVFLVVFLVGDIYFFFQNGDLNSRIDSLSKTRTSLESQISLLSADKKSLSGQLDSLNKTVTDLTNQISIFAAPADTSVASVSFDVTGKLSGGDKSQYVLTTSKGVLLYVKNYKDAAVDVALKPYLNKEVRIQGAHQPGSTSLTVAAVNGQQIEVVAKATSTSQPTSPVGSSSTTPSAATSVP